MSQAFSTHPKKREGKKTQSIQSLGQKENKEWKSLTGNELLFYLKKKKKPTTTGSLLLMLAEDSPAPPYTPPQKLPQIEI